MVILKFNKLIRNKWLWGAFAAVISAAFCFEGLFRPDNDKGPKDSNAGTLSGSPVNPVLFADCVEDARGYGESKDTQGAINKRAAEMYAALEVAKKNGISISDKAIENRVMMMFGGAANFNFENYKAILGAQLRTTPERFEASLRRRMTVDDGIARAILPAATWVSPKEIDRAVSDETDLFTIKVATFTEDKAAAKLIKLSDAEIEKWYKKNSSRYALPDRMKVRLLRYDENNKDILAKMKVTNDEMRDYYDANIDKYSSKGTNGVEVVKKFDDVKASIEKELRKIAAINYYETNLSLRVYKDLQKGAKVSRLDVLAKEDGLKVTTSGWFSLENVYVDKFMVRRSGICPGASNFSEVVAELDPDTEDLRYGIVSSQNAVWVIERSEFSKAHTPEFKDAKVKITPDAIADAKAEAFKKSVEQIIAKGTKEVLAKGKVSTNIVFSVSETERSAIKNYSSVVPAAVKLFKGELSPFVLISKGVAAVIYCVDRVAADPAKTMLARSRIREMASYPAYSQLSSDWGKLNLEKMGFVPGADNSFDDSVEE
jgi:hypothetical protein